MESKRRLADGFERGVSVFVPDENRPRRAAIRTAIRARDKGTIWREEEAPDSCFKPPGPPGAPELKAGEWVYVSNPAGALAACRIEGWGKIQDVSKDTATVLFDQPWTGHADPHRTWHVFLAACHREGPQSEPPDEGAVFLGRLPWWDIMADYWWHDHHVKSSENPVGFGQAAASIDAGDNTWGNPVQLLSFRRALVVARALGLVDAEPEQPEPKFQVGQCAERQRLPIKFRIEKIAWEPSVLRWTYSGHVADGSFVYACEDDLEPCAPILTAEQEALRPGDVVEDIEILVSSDGVPIPSPARLAGPETIEFVTFRLTNCHEAGLTHDRVVWLWNLKLAKKADT